MKAERIGYLAAVGLAALTMKGEPAESPDPSGWQGTAEAPRLSDASGVTFRGDRSADLVRNYRFAEAVDAAFWEGLGLGERSCEERTVVFTDEFADEPDTDPRSEPNAAFDAATCTEWINSETFADNPWGLAYTATHEGGHDRGVRDSADPDSLMYDNNQGDDARDRRFGEPAPEAATKERFERQFGVDLEFKGR